jgi:tetratricopeptide (TPR) repeat protein
MSDDMTISKPPPLVEEELDLHHEPLRGLIKLCEAALRSISEPAQAARLIYATARIFEERLEDTLRANARFLDAFGRDPSFLPNLRAARRLKKEARDWPAVLDLIEVEYRQTKNARLRAELCLEKAFILRTFLGDLEQTEEAYGRARGHDSANAEAWLCSVWCLAESKTWGRLAELLEQIAGRVQDGDVQSALMASRSLLHLEQLDDPPGARAVGLKLLRQEPLRPLAAVALWQVLQRTESWTELIELFEHLVENGAGPFQVYCYYQLARLHSVRTGRTDLAVRALEKAVGLEPNNYFLLSELRDFYDRAGRNQDRALIEQRMLEHCDDSTVALGLHHRLGRAYETIFKDHDEAMAHYRAAVENSPHFLPAIQALGRLYRRHHRWEDLLQMHRLEAEAAVEREHQAWCHYRAGELLETKLQRDHEAMEQYRTALHCVSCFVPAIRALSRLFTKAELWPELIALREEEAANLRGGSVAISQRAAALRVARLEQIGRLWEEKVGDLDRAAETYRRILDLDSGHLGALYCLKRIYEKSESWTQLMELLEREIELVHDQNWAAELLYQIGEIAEGRLNERNLALLHYRQSLTIRPTYVPTLIALGRIYTQQGRYADLAAMYAKEAEVTESPRQRAFLLFRMGELYESQLQDPEKAEGCYREGLELFPDFWPAYAAYQRLLTERGAWAELADAYEREGQLHSSSQQKTTAYFLAGQLWEERLARPENAADAYARALAADPSFQSVRWALIRLYRQLERWEELASLLEKQRMELDDSFALLLVLTELGRLYHFQLNLPEKACEVYREVVTLAEHDSAALLALAELAWRHGTGEQLLAACQGVASNCYESNIRAGATRVQARILSEWLSDSSSTRDVWQEVDDLLPGPQARVQRPAGENTPDPDSLLPAEVFAAVALLLAKAQRAPEEFSLALEQVAEVFGALDDYQGLALTYERVLGRLNQTQDEDNEGIHLTTPMLLRAALAAVRAQASGQLQPAIIALRDVRDRRPSLVPETLALARLLAQQPADREEAVRLYLAAWFRGPERVNVLREIESLWRTMELDDRSALAVALRCALHAATDEERETFLAWHPLPPADQLKPWSRQSLMQHLGAPVLSQTLPNEETIGLVAGLEPLFAKLYPPDLASLGLEQADHIPRLEQLPLRRLGDHVARLFAVEDFNLFLHGSPDRIFGLELTEPPAILLPERMTTWAHTQQLGAVALVMCHLTLGGWPVMKFDPYGFAMFLAAATRLHVKGFGDDAFPRASVEGRCRAMRKILSPDEIDSLGDAAKAFAASEFSGEAARYYQWAQRSCQRAALLVSSDPAGSLNLLRTVLLARRQHSTATTADVVRFIKDRTEVEDLLQWYFSEHHFALREEAGWAAKAC